MGKINKSEPKPINDVPQSEAIISVVEVGDRLHSSCSDVFWQTEGAVGHLFQGPSHQLFDSITSK